MGTAPTDGRLFVASGLNFGNGPGRHTVFAKWDTDNGRWTDVEDEATELTYLTHWFDVDELPSPDGGEQ
jgi:hypothetical protein